MNLKDQVVNLKLSKKLKQLGIKSKSIFGWVKHNDDGKKEWILIKGTNDLNPMLWGKDDCKLQEQKDKEISAFTSSELMAILPNRITCSDDRPFDTFTLYIKKCVKVEHDPFDIWKNPEFCSGRIIIDKVIPAYLINYECDSTECSGEDAWLKRNLFEHNMSDENFSNALAKTLIYLIENKLT